GRHFRSAPLWSILVGCFAHPLHGDGMKAIGISLLLAAIPIGLVVYLAFTGDIGIPPHWTVDGLFMTLILLTISGILALNAVLEARAQGLIRIPGLGEPA